MDNSSGHHDVSSPFSLNLHRLTDFPRMMYVLGSQAGYELDAQAPLEDPAGHLLAADVLSFGGIIFSSAAGWAPVAADFNCRLPATMSKTRVFGLTWIGLMLPLIFVESLGVMLMTVPDYATTYLDGDAGALIKKGMCTRVIDSCF